jgi:hypothetical protein
MVLHSYNLAEWNGVTILCYAFAFALAFYIPIFYMGRMFWGGAD